MNILPSDYTFGVVYLMRYRGEPWYELAAPNGIYWAGYTSSSRGTPTSGKYYTQSLDRRIRELRQLSEESSFTITPIGMTITQFRAMYEIYRTHHYPFIP